MKLRLDYDNTPSHITYRPVHLDSWETSHNESVRSRTENLTEINALNVSNYLLV